METKIDITPDLSLDAKKNLEDALETIRKLKEEITELEKICTPVYDKYKPFKSISVGARFVYGPYSYIKKETFYMLDSFVNAFNEDSKRYIYLSDNDWVVEI